MQTQSSTYKSNQGWFFAQLGCFIHPLFLFPFSLSFYRGDGWVSPPALRPQHSAGRQTDTWLSPTQ